MHDRLPKTKLRLGAYESIAVYALPELLARLRAKHPTLVVLIRAGRTGPLTQLVRTGELDAALLAQPDVTGKLDVDVLTRDELAAAVLPARVASRVPGELRRIPAPSVSVVDAGRHDICFVSRSSVNANVRDVVAAELRAVLC